MLELNVWTSSLVEKIGKGEGGQWDVTVRRGGPNGSVRILHPTHVVVAPGLFGKPYVPHFEGKVRQLLTREPGTEFTVNAGKLQRGALPCIRLHQREEQRRQESCRNRCWNLRP